MDVPAAKLDIDKHAAPEEVPYVGTVLDEHQHTHVLSWQLLVAVWVVLMGFTALTVWQAQLDLGNIDLAIAMVIATTKALLVALIFMHLKWDRPFNGLIFMASLVFAGLFIAISMLDTGSNQPAIETRLYDQPLETRPDYASHAAHGEEHAEDGHEEGAAGGGDGHDADDADTHGEGVESHGAGDQDAGADH